ncbi:ABC transporter ATP-binding protein [Ktedonosporobacter rubrisoli]|uniref:ABC transporter ATP-binding protein n=1 Tax=Ktedonosporobacter rubrisoli TaxID=2509675 RepID=A0A4P6JIS2_KTERU|nr:ABC transporter ATP-binding protein [Ktedonosporobacter rubrisoli]QBD74812.1 ABC transporter ATP-binding protein [Ktedonosporobacter rubrisoli]
MHKIRRWLTLIAGTMRYIGQMLWLAWQVQPVYCVALIVLEILQGIVPLATAWIIKSIIDLLTQHFHAQDPGQLVRGLMALLLIQAVILIVAQLGAPLSEFLLAELSRKLTLQVKTTIYQKINSLAGISHFEDPQFHNTIEMVATHAQMAPTQMLQNVNMLCKGAATLLSFLGVLIALSPLLALIVCITVLPQAVVQIKLSRQRFDMFFDNSPRERRAAYYGRLLSWAPYAKEVRLFNLGQYFLTRFTEMTRLILGAQSQQQIRELRWQGGLAFLSTIVTSGALVVVVLQAFSGRISIGDIVFYISAVESIQSTLSSMAFELSNMNDSMLFFRQYKELLHLQEEQLSVTQEPCAVPPLTSGITLRNVSFRYSEQQPWVLRHINLFLPACQCLALVGLNGAGKTTLIKLLTRLYDPTEGEILWDGIDIREFEPQELRRNMGAIFQDFVRYELTVHENIGLGNTDLLENTVEIQKAALKAGIHERIEKLADGYQSMLSLWMAEEKGGTDFSVGEWQKLALARMFMRDSQVLILDEPTASLDAQAEYELYQHFRELMRGHTCILITHRFNTVRMAEQIAVLEEGQISELGTHKELLERNGTYAQLYGMQAESYRA